MSGIARVNRHDRHFIQQMRIFGNAFCRCRRVQHHPALFARILDLIQQAEYFVIRRLGMKADDIGAGLETHWNDIFRMIHHQMNINGHSSNFFQILNKKGRQCDIADVIAIHYINMVKIRFFIHCRDLLFELR
ncbi:Uncharacterised protein [Klebsiella pneumoniae]|nr:Uncharacterised protein [Klebsiella pneumoniae]